MISMKLRYATLLAILLSGLLVLGACGGEPTGENQADGDSAGDADGDGSGDGGDGDGTTGDGDGDGATGDGDGDGDTCSDPCTAGASRCVEGATQTCVSIDGCPRWSDPTDCGDDEVCSGGQCAEDCLEICTLGERECVGEEYRECEENFDGCADWTPPQSCSAGESCSGGQCGDSCTDACDEGAKRCDNEATFQVCEEQSSGCLDWSGAESCPNGAACDGGECQGCADGSRRCSDNGTGVEECSDDDWTLVQSCPLGCDGASCATETSCQPGSYQCNGNVVEVCNTSGSAYLHIATCAVDCDAGLCTGECAPGEKRCNGDNVEVCNGSGTAWDTDETCDNRCDSSVAACALEELDITSDTTMNGTIIVDGPVTVRSGADLYSPEGNLKIYATTITVVEGGSITVAPIGDDPRGKGNLSTSTCWHSGAYRYTGGSGGSYGGRGQNTPCTGAPNPFVRSDEIEVGVGSAGGDGRNASGTDGMGGLGGGVVHLIADQINVEGSIRADGDHGNLEASSCTNTSGGGGSGGGVLLAADDLTFSGTISVQGGDGASGTCTGNYGGDGGDGVVKFLHGASIDNTGSVSGVSYTGLLAPLQISSTTHPDSQRYYNDDFDTIALSWDRPFPAVQGYYHSFNDVRNFVPTPGNSTFLDDEVVTYTRDDVVDGQNYFHIIAVDAQINPGTMEARKVINVNTSPPSVSSDSHPNQHSWSSNANVFIQWSDQRAEENFTGYYYRVDEFGDTVPTTNDTFVPLDQKQTLLSNRPDGIWAFHIVPIDTFGYLTKEAATYRFRIGDDPGEGTILGVVRDEDQETISGATITINRGLFHGAIPDQTSSAGGNYNFTAVPAGEWELRVTADGYETKDIAVSLNDGQSRTVDITLEEAN